MNPFTGNIHRYWISACEGELSRCALFAVFRSSLLKYDPAHNKSPDGRTVMHEFTSLNGIVLGAWIHTTTMHKYAINKLCMVHLFTTLNKLCMAHEFTPLNRLCMAHEFTPLNRLCMAHEFTTLNRLCMVHEFKTLNRLCMVHEFTPLNRQMSGAWIHWLTRPLIAGRAF